MAKLHFIYGTVGSGKTLHLLSVKHNYANKGQSVLILKPSTDTRYGLKSVKSRSGLASDADIVIAENETSFDPSSVTNQSAVLVDECQFLQPSFVDDLRNFALDRDIPVLCFGLKTDFQGNLFPASKRFIEISDTTEEIKTLCLHCHKKATMNLRICDGKPTHEGPQILIGADESYQAVCYEHYRDLIKEEER